MSDKRNHRFAITPDWVFEVCLSAKFETEAGKLGPDDLATYGVLALHQNRHGHCWPSIGTIAKIRGTQERAVKASLRRLRLAGLIVVNEHFSSNGTQLSNSYYLPADRPDWMPPITKEEAGGGREVGPEQFGHDDRDDEWGGEGDVSDAPTPPLERNQHALRDHPPSPQSVSRGGPSTTPKQDQDKHYQRTNQGTQQGSSLRSERAREADAPPPFSLTPDTQPAEKPKRATRLTLEALPPDWAAWARQQGHQRPEAEWEKFRDYWIAAPGQKGVKADWLATWRNWIRRAVEGGGGGGRAAAPRNERMEALDRVFEQIDGRGLMPRDAESYGRD